MIIIMTITCLQRTDGPQPPYIIYPAPLKSIDVIHTSPNSANSITIDTGADGQTPMSLMMLGWSK